MTRRAIHRPIQCQFIGHSRLVSTDPPAGAWLYPALTDRYWPPV